jgi:hypothetical protein
MRKQAQLAGGSVVGSWDITSWEYRWGFSSTPPFAENGTIYFIIYPFLALFASNTHNLNPEKCADRPFWIEGRIQIHGRVWRMKNGGFGGPDFPE